MREIRNCNVCVVGGAGFLGSHLAHYLVDNRDCNVLVIDNLITGKKEHLPEKAIFEHADITGSEDYLLQLFKYHKIQFVFNYAAEPYIPLSFERPLHVFNTNAFGALKVINAAHDADVEAILQVSSAEIYGDCHGKISETAPVVPHSTYGASKAAIDFAVQARWKEAETPCISLRQFNCVGERETHPYIVPEIISQLFQAPNGTLDDNASVVIQLGNNSRRDFLYAGDAVAMAVELLEKGNFGDVYNLGSENDIKMYDLAFLLADLAGIPAYVETESSRIRPWEIWQLKSDNTKIYSAVDYRPLVEFEDALKRTIDNYKDNNFRWGWE